MFCKMCLKGLRWSRKAYAALAQLVERSLSKRKVAGSSPACGCIFFRYSPILRGFLFQFKIIPI